MEYYAVLTVATLLIAALLVVIVVRTRNLAFPIGIAFIYYLSLYGGWSIVADRLGGNSGMHYQYLETKLFSITLDRNYFWTLVLYAVFVIVVELAILLTIDATPVEDPAPAIRIDVSRLLLFAGVAGFVSIVLVLDDLRAAHEAGQSGYEFMKRGLGEVSASFTLHQALLRAASTALAIATAVLLSGPNPRVLESDGRRHVFAGCAVLLGALLWVSFALGYKSELFFAGVVGCLLYLVNARRPRYRLIALGAVLGGLLMGLIDLWRFLPPAEMAKKLVELDFSEMLDALTLIGSSNEAFASHFSLYGALSRGIPLTYGSSFISLIASVVPRLLWTNRPQEIYAYYVEQVQGTAGQGYTIHHAAGWYLNFGVPGVVYGAALLGCVWAGLFRMFQRRRASSSDWKNMFAIISPWAMTAYMPFILHAGPEVYRGLFLEGFGIPTLILVFAARGARNEPSGTAVTPAAR